MRRRGRMERRPRPGAASRSRRSASRLERCSTLTPRRSPHRSIRATTPHRPVCSVPATTARWSSRTTLIAGRRRERADRAVRTADDRRVAVRLPGCRFRWPASRLDRPGSSGVLRRVPDRSANDRRRPACGARAAADRWRRATPPVDRRRSQPRPHRSGGATGSRTEATRRGGGAAREAPPRDGVARPNATGVRVRCKGLHSEVVARRNSRHLFLRRSCRFRRYWSPRSRARVGVTLPRSAGPSGAPAPDPPRVNRARRTHARGRRARAARRRLCHPPADRPVSECRSMQPHGPGSGTRPSPSANRPVARHASSCRSSTWHRSASTYPRARRAAALVHDDSSPRPPASRFSSRRRPPISGPACTRRRPRRGRPREVPPAVDRRARPARRPPRPTDR